VPVTVGRDGFIKLSRNLYTFCEPLITAECQWISGLKRGHYALINRKYEQSDEQHCILTTKCRVQWSELHLWSPDLLVSSKAIATHWRPGQLEEQPVWSLHATPVQHWVSSIYAPRAPILMSGPRTGSRCHCRSRWPMVDGREDVDWPRLGPLDRVCAVRFYGSLVITLGELASRKWPTKLHVYVTVERFQLEMVWLSVVTIGLYSPEVCSSRQAKKHGLKLVYLIFSTKSWRNRQKWSTT